MHFLFVTQFSAEEVREHIEYYLRQSQQVVEDDRDMCLLCVRCLEVQNLHIECARYYCSVFNQSTSCHN